MPPPQHNLSAQHAHFFNGAIVLQSEIVSCGHFDFGDREFAVTNPAIFRFRAQLTIDTVKVDVNYRIDAPNEPLK